MKKSVIIKLTAVFLAFTLFYGINPVLSEDSTNYGLIINGAFINNETTAATLEGITYIPLNKINDLLGIRIIQQAGTITVSRDKLSLTLKVWQEKAFVERNGLQEDKWAYIKGRMLYVPISFLTEYLDLNVEVLHSVKFIKINKKTEGQSEAPTESSKKGTKVAFLTFDDGLDSKVTPQVLDILKQYDIKATFFIIGNTISKNKELLKRIKDEGHTIGNHTYTHKKGIIYTDVRSFSAELEKTSKAIYDTVGITSNLFRPPYGAPYIKGQEYKDALSQYKTILWNVDSMDSRVKGISSSEIITAVENQVRSKSKAIILFHSTSAREETVKALPAIIQYLIDNGYAISKLE